MKFHVCIFTALLCICKVFLFAEKAILMSQTYHIPQFKIFNLLLLFMKNDCISRKILPFAVSFFLGKFRYPTYLLHLIFTSTMFRINALLEFIRDFILHDNQNFFYCSFNTEISSSIGSISF